MENIKVGNAINFVFFILYFLFTLFFYVVNPIFSSWDMEKNEIREKNMFLSATQ